MSEPRVIALHSVDLGVADLDATTAFFADVWGLTLVARDSASSSGTRPAARMHGGVDSRRGGFPGRQEP